MKVIKPPTVNISFNEAIHNALFDENITIVSSQGEYWHWDKLRHLQPPEMLSVEEWWAVIKFKRKALFKSLPFGDNYHKPFVFALPDIILQKLHYIDRHLGNVVANHDYPILNTNLRDTFIMQSLFEEAITSSQLEGASTTRQVAKEMLRTQRKPINIDEKMIFNNFQGMEYIQTIKNNSLSLEHIFTLHRILTDETLDKPSFAGKLRDDDSIHIIDGRDNKILHIPPPAHELAARLENFCQFANRPNDRFSYFMHPIIKAIILHFLLAYIHPFIDGNGRTARALFYWSMLNSGYWLAEFISISNAIKRAPVKYAKAYLYTETDENDLTYFIFHQLNIIENAIEHLQKFIVKQTNELHHLQNLIDTNDHLHSKLNHRQIMVIKHALNHTNRQYLIEGHKESHRITYETARSDLLKLVKLGLLVKRKVGKTFVFVAASDLKQKMEIL